MAVVVKDPASGLSKGSAFVKFDSPAAAQACVQVRPAPLHLGPI